MRFLCLHGSGTSAQIIRYQLSALKTALGPSHTFDFLDAPCPDTAGPGVGPFFDPPFYSWWPKPTKDNIVTAIKALLVRISSSDKTYDAVVGFSQGTSLLTATTIYCQNENIPLPWKGAICICGGIPYELLECYMPVSEKAKDLVVQTRRDLDASSDRNAKKIEEMMETGNRVDLWDYPSTLWDGKEVITRDPWVLPDVDEKDVYGLDVSNLPEKVRLSIPTAHIYGHKDPMSAFHVQLATLSDAGRRIVYDHRGGHEVPRVPRVVQDLVKVVEWLEKRISENR
ncbi:hypothetical protein DOTSEDRAFT_52852 [Dothistroma septosporum NZE10]|uniref:Serine hydrolase domain-containing protein n=1 Tax=Dothistroma septosporum (strain NZE10 / CBS 128990) TaxID=675120 RepID=N1PQB8_DOTSN|nr:hypothetical protein DOTSEDRAFT_52852 [Dothistroma septosporum NZE10]